MPFLKRGSINSPPRHPLLFARPGEEAQAKEERVMMWAGFFMIATVASFAVCVPSVAMQPEF